jgi:fibronectin type 3 domain-containing protein
VANPDNLSSFAAVRSSDGALTVVVINKQQGTTPVTVSLANFPTTGTAQAYQVSSATQTAIKALGSVTVANNQIATTVPSQSITLFVIPAGTVVTKPTAPTGLAATTGSGTATITWLAVGGATSYTVQRATSSSGPFKTVGTVTSPAPTSFTDTGLTNGTTYYYEVSGTNKAGTGPNSAPLAVTPEPPPVFAATATAAPATIAASGTSTVTFTVKNTGGPITNTNVEIQVTGPGGAAAGYQVYSGQNFAADGSLTFTYSWTPSKLSPVITLDGAYAVAIGVFNSTWATDYYWNGSATTINLTGGTAPPSFTSAATATPSTISPSGSSTVKFSVKDTGGALSNANVEVQVFDSASQAVGTGVFSGQNFTAGGTLQYTYTWIPSSQSPPVVASGNYAVAIGVFDSGWTTDYYWNGNAAAVTLSNAPPAPTALKAVAGTGEVTLSWTGSSGATSYKLYRGTKANGESGTPIASGVTKTSYVDSKVTDGTTYYYKVAAINAQGTSALSAEASATPNLTPTVKLVSSATSNVAWGTSVTLTATVSGSGAEPTGTVKFYTGSSLLGSGSLSGGVTIFKTSELLPGTNEVSAVYEGNSTYIAIESAKVPVVVLKGTPGEDLTVTPNPAVAGSVVTVGLKLNAVIGLPVPTGTVIFVVDGVSEATVTLSDGAADWKSSTLAAGKHTFHIEYSGNADYNAVTGTTTGTVTAAAASVRSLNPAGR